MEKQLNKLLDAIKADYTAHARRWTTTDADKKQHIEDMITQHSAELGYKIGKKYIKITERNGGSAWGFVVNTDTDARFKRGDILKSAGFSTPARNKARGNIIDENFSWVRWTGPEYLK